MTSDDKALLEDLLETVSALTQGDAVTPDEEEALQSIQQTLEGLLQQLQQAAQSGDTENIAQVEEVTAENVALEDKADLTEAKADLESALEQFGELIGELEALAEG